MASEERIRRGRRGPALSPRERPSCSGTPRATKRRTLDAYRLGWQVIGVVGLLCFIVGCQSKMFHVERVPIDPTDRELQLSAVHGYGTCSARYANGIQFTLRDCAHGRALDRIYGGSSDGPVTITDLDAGTYEVWAGGPTWGSYRTRIPIANGERVVTVFDVSAAHKGAERAPIDHISWADAVKTTGVMSRSVGLTTLKVLAIGFSSGCSGFIR